MAEIDEKKVKTGEEESEEEVEETESEEDDAEAGEEGEPAKNKKGSKEEEDGEEGEEDAGEEGEEDDKEPEVPVRKSAAQHIIARKNRTIENLRKKKGAEGDDDPNGDEEEEEDGDDLTPPARNAVRRHIDRAVAPLVRALGDQADEAELKELYAAEPEAKKMDKQIRAYMKHAEYKGVPPAVIYHHLAFDKAAKVGIERKKNADKEAKHSRGGGRTIRPKNSESGNVPTAEEIDDMDDKEFEELQHKARTGQFVK